MNFQLKSLPVLLCLSLTLAACGGAELVASSNEPLESDSSEYDSTGEFESEPVLEEEGSLEQGLVSCTPSTQTAYQAGKGYPILCVNADSKLAELKTANAYAVMQAAAANAGVYLKVVSGFRTMAQQQYLYACYVNCNCNGCNLAAKPGTSNHQSGEALDLNTREPKVLTWLTANGAKFGFYRTVPKEPWHWEYKGGGPGGGPCSSGGMSGGSGPGTAGQIVIDSNNGRNDKAKGYIELSDNWSDGQGTQGFFGTGYFYASTEPVSDGASFWFYLPQAGTRTIDAWWSAGSNRATAAPFVAFDGSGKEVGRTTADQSTNGGKWVELGAWSFPQGWNRIVLSRWTTPGSVVIADAVRVR